MRLVIAAVGRTRQGAEVDLIGTYRARTNELARNLGFSELDIIEVEARGLTGTKRNEREAQLLLNAVPEGALCVTLDEKGKEMSSHAFAQWLKQLRDDGTKTCCFLIGGADGLSPAAKAKAAHCLSLGPMTWPHLLVRTMLSEQLYRALSILAGHPYHRA